MIEEGRLVFRIPITELDYSVYKDPLSENVTICNFSLTKNNSNGNHLLFSLFSPLLLSGK